MDGWMDSQTDRSVSGCLEMYCRLDRSVVGWADRSFRSVGGYLHMLYC